MGTFRIGDATLELRPIGAGVRNGWLPEPVAHRDLHLTLEEARDLAAFQAAGWQFVAESDADFDWGTVRAKNRDDVEAGLLARHPWGGLVIIRNHVIAPLPPDAELSALDPEVGSFHGVPFADDIIDIYLRLPARNLEATISHALAFLHALDGSAIGEPLISYHLVHHGTVVAAKTDPYTQWHWDKIELENAWSVRGQTASLAVRGQGIRVAIIDLGFHDDEPQISPNVTAYVDDSGKYIPGQAVPPDSHGTVCVGVVSALNDRMSVNGAAPESCRLLIAVPSVTTQLGVAGAIALATRGLNGNDGADVISCSLGPYARPWELSCTLRARIDEARASGRNTLGIPIFWADFDVAEPIPSKSVENYGGIVCVGHSDEYDVVAPCGYGSGLDLVAPGVAVATILREGSSVMVGLSYGASIAAPCAAGVAALILSLNPSLTCQQVVDAMLQGCDPAPQQGQSKVRIDDIRGWGRLNARRALEIASTF